MKHVRRSGAMATAAAALAIAGTALTAALAGPAPAAITPEPVVGLSIGVPQTYPRQIALKARGDTWYDTWGGRAYRGDIFVTSDDSTGFGGKCDSNIVVNELRGSTPGDLSLAFENCMSSFGAKGATGNYRDGRSWKTDGILAVGGALYLVVDRQQDGSGGWPDGFQPSSNASIVKSADGGRTWSNGFGVSDAASGAAPRIVKGPGGRYAIQATFPGDSFATPQFINYGQADNPASTADGGNRYVYAISTDGYAYDGSSMILGRVPRSEIGRLSGADWQFYTGQAGGDGGNPADWSGNVSNARPILTAAHQLSQSAVQYVPGLNQYVMADFYYPFARSWGNAKNRGGAASQTTWAFYESPHPWGPWTEFFSQPTTVCYITCSAVNAEQLGLYDPALVSKFISMDGLSDVIFSSGDFTVLDQSRPNDSLLYMLHAFPVTFEVSNKKTVDDGMAWPPGSTDWHARYGASGYYDDTVHYSGIAGDSIAFTFTGTSISWVGSKNRDHGIAEVSIDGGSPTPVDTYNSQWLAQQVLFTASGLASGPHTLTIEVTSRKDPSSSGTYQDIDALIVGS